MVRGRKSTGKALEERYVCRISDKQKEVLRKNPWISVELNEYVRNYLNNFLENEITENNVDKTGK